jgi:hypothetical protein
MLYMGINVIINKLGVNFYAPSYKRTSDSIKYWERGTAWYQ